ncbi:restriction endonuclease PLD domain-containing protein [Flavobacterium sp. MDT1-60]|uniref:restriction endonuclease PLD domain-containing protein n=1 Tax=Flavobacterium sp. MDT1-60 TaxID=1979344 RepID=UPI00177B95C4|nr:restriction endonuclease PLD domain-containing protein [Flavobacterium sp. MDT1-60]QOG03467.1 NgoFVII family restriction endonuclease [Flavobacterium sp. MDT1-60]
MISIALRTDLNISYFKQNILSILSYPDFDSVVICSGYFQENNKYSVTGDEIVKTILANPNFGKISYTIIGGNFGYTFRGVKPDWHNQFDSFLNSLKTNGISFNAFLERRRKWHAKIAIGLQEKTPKVAIIGSSNFTAPAYSENHNTYNVECDIILLLKEKQLENHFNLQSFVTADNPLSPIIANIDFDFNQPDLLERLQAINRELMDGENLEEYTDF